MSTAYSIALGETGLRRSSAVLKAAIGPICDTVQGDSVDVNTCVMGRVREWAQEIADHGRTFASLSQSLAASPSAADSTDPAVREIQTRLVVGEAGMAKALAAIGQTLQDRADFFRKTATDLSELAVAYRKNGRGWQELAANPDNTDPTVAALQAKEQFSAAENMVFLGLSLADLGFLDLSYARKLRGLAEQLITDRFKERSVYFQSLGAALAGWRSTLAAWQSDNEGGFVSFLGRLGHGVLAIPGFLAKSLGAGIGEGLAALGKGVGAGAAGAIAPLFKYAVAAFVAYLIAKEAGLISNR